MRPPHPKRILDVAGATFLLVVLLPLELAVLAAYAADVLLSPRDRGALFYREPRVSRGRTFGLLKFRTLRMEVLAHAAGHARPLEADPSNLTWLGRRVLKPWYLDELPQLWNILRGDLSLVGPRPWPPELVERQRAEGLTYRDDLTAGLTGPAQLTKGSSRRYADLDLEYLDRTRRLKAWGLVRYDLKILVLTIRLMARGEGLSN
ncbi:MAG TPA: sugar transferase [Gaiellaceae bacterium]|nr:sugar transferase [Gaiellaceae bacterium]